MDMKLSQNISVPLRTSPGLCNNNTIILGSMKHSCYMQSALHDMDGSFLIVDPYGELYRTEAESLRKRGYYVRTLDLISPGSGESYDPFQYIKTDDDIQDFVNSFDDGSEADSESSEAKKHLLTAMIHYQMKFGDARQCNFENLYGLLNDRKIDKLINATAISDPGNTAAQAYSKFITYPKGIRNEAIWECMKKFRLFLTGDIGRVMNRNDYNFAEMREHKTAYFIVLPMNNMLHTILVRMMVAQIFSMIMNEDSHDGLHIQFFIDEFENIGKLQNIVKMVELDKDSNTGITLMIQSVEWTYDLYGNVFNTIATNCHSMVFMGSRNISTILYVQHWIGMTRMLINSHIFKYSIREHTMTEEKLKNMPKNMCIVIQHGKKAILDKKISPVQ